MLPLSCTKKTSTRSANKLLGGPRPTLKAQNLSASRSRPTVRSIWNTSKFTQKMTPRKRSTLMTTTNGEPCPMRESSTKSQRWMTLTRRSNTHGSSCYRYPLSTSSLLLFSTCNTLVVVQATSMPVILQGNTLLIKLNAKNSDCSISQWAHLSLLNVASWCVWWCISKKSWRDTKDAATAGVCSSTPKSQSACSMS